MNSEALIEAVKGLRDPKLFKGEQWIVLDDVIALIRQHSQPANDLAQVQHDEMVILNRCLPKDVPANRDDLTAASMELAAHFTLPPLDNLGR